MGVVGVAVVCVGEIIVFVGVVRVMRSVGEVVVGFMLVWWGKACYALFIHLTLTLHWRLLVFLYILYTDPSLRVI